MGLCRPTSNQYGHAPALNAIMVDVQEGLQRIQLPDGIVARLARIMTAVPSQVLRIAVAILHAIGQVMFVLLTHLCQPCPTYRLFSMSWSFSRQGWALHLRDLGA